MASAAVDVLGAVSGVLGIIGFTGGSASNKDSSVGIELQIGLPQNPQTKKKLKGAEGRFGNAYVFNSVNERVGSKDIINHYLDRGEAYRFNIDVDGQSVEYLEVTASQDAVCMSWMAVIGQSAVRDTTYAWFGDFYQYCGIEGAEWYYGNVPAGTEKNTGNEHYPKCAWIDKDHTNGHQYASMKARMPAFRSVDGQDKNYYCRPPVFELGTDTNVINKRSGIDRAHSRDLPAVAKRNVGGNDTRLVTSPRESQTATELCEAPNSSGPDFVSLMEGLYCDMTTRELLPICSLTGLSENCFDLDVAGKALAGLFNGKLIQKTYSAVLEFGSED